PCVAAHRQVLRERGQQLVLRRSGPQELGVDETNLDVVSHGHLLQLNPSPRRPTIAYRLPKRQDMQMAFPGTSPGSIDQLPFLDPRTGENILGLLPGTVRLCEYTPLWAELYEAEAQRIRSALRE